VNTQVKKVFMPFLTELGEGGHFSAVPAGLTDFGAAPGSELPGYFQAVPPGRNKGGHVVDAGDFPDGKDLNPWF